MAPCVASAYNHAGQYTFAARWDEAGASTSGGVTTYPAEHRGANEYDVCPPRQLSLMFPAAVVAGNIRQTCSNLWVALLESSQTLGSAITLTRAKDLSEDWDLNFVDPSVGNVNHWFDWYDNQYNSPSSWGNPTVSRSGYPLTLSGGPHAGEPVLNNDRLLALGDDNLIMLDADGSLSIYRYGGGTLRSNPTATTFTSGAWNGQTLVSKLRYMVGHEEGRLYFVEGASTLHVYNEALTWQRTDQVALGHELAAYTLGELVDNRIPGYTYIGWDVGPIVIGVTALRPLDHLVITADSAGGTAGVPATFTIKACATPDCSTPYTRGVSGTLTSSDGSSVPFSIAQGTSATTANLVIATAPASGHVTVGYSGLSVAPVGSPTLHCGFGVPATSSTTCHYSVVPPLHHLAITASTGRGLTCTPTAFTITACADAACSAHYTGGLTGQLVAHGTGATVLPSSAIAFDIGAGAHSQTLGMQITKVPATGYVTVGASGLSSMPSDTPAVHCGLGMAPSGTASCQFPVDTAALLLSVPNHLAESGAPLTVKAIRQGDSATSCAPAFVNVTRPIRLACAYGNPASGSLPVRINGTALNTAGHASMACGSGATVHLAFDGTGTATATLMYADAGLMTVSGSYMGSGVDADLSMAGDASFVASPAAFGFTGITAAPLIAGQPFSATLTALNSAGQATPNFGRETPASSDHVRLSWTRRRPTGPGAVNGDFTGKGTGTSPSLGSGSFSNGAATVTDLAWSEVGSGDLSASLVGGAYLSAGAAVTGTTGMAGAVGPFVPHHFDVKVAPSCGTFTFSGQPFTTTVSARNATGGLTLNHDGSAATTPNQALPFTLSAPSNGAVGTLTGTAVPASRFISGTAAVSPGPAFTFTHKLTAPLAVAIRATDSGGVSSSAGLEQSMALRSGRLKMSNAFGSEKANLNIPIQSQHWNGSAWILNNADSCTALPAAAIALSHYVNGKGQPTAAWTTTPSSVAIAGGHGTLTLSPPGNGATGSVDLALNLGATGIDQSCLPAHPASTGAARAWLRSQNGSTHGCTGITTYDRDPSARATFGIYTPESRKVIHLRDLF